MITPFFERPSSVIERTKKSFEGIHSVPEPAKANIFDGWRQKRSETPTKKHWQQKLSEEKTGSKEALWKYEWYTELSSILNSQ